MFGKIRKILHALFGHIGRHCQGELGAFKVFRHHVGRLGGVEVVNEGFLGGHPVAEKDVDLAVFHGLIADRHRQRLDVGLIPQSIEQNRGDAIGGGDVGPAGIAEANGLAGRIIGGIKRGGEGRHGQKQTGGDAVHARNGFHCSSLLLVQFIEHHIVFACEAGIFR